MIEFDGGETMQGKMRMRILKDIDENAVESYKCEAWFRHSLTCLPKMSVVRRRYMYSVLTLKVKTGKR